MIYVDVETTGLDARQNHIRLVSIDGDVYDLYTGAGALEEARERLSSDSEWCGHNIAFDLDFIQEHIGIEPDSVFDTMVAYQILSNGRGESASLGNVSGNLLGTTMSKEYQKIGWDAMILEPAAYEYAAKDTAILPDLHKKLSKMLTASGLWDLFNFEMILLPVLLRMKRKGVLIDEKAAKALVDELEAKSSRLELTLPARLNPRSPKQVVSYFPRLESASEDDLRNYVEETGDETAKTVMKVKKTWKKASSIRKQLLNRLSLDGRVHPSFSQTFTETGRLAARDPNIQNMDRGDDVRSLFIPPEGMLYVIADYSGIELRLAALLSGDANMLRAYADGRDLHSETCRRIFGEETKTTRTLSKNINFGLVFGGGHGTLMKFAARSGVEITEEEAIAYKAAFHSAYPSLTQWQKRQGTAKTEYVYSRRGRRRHIEIGEDYCTRINHTVQATAADGLKRALILQDRRGIVPVLTVHDEIVLEAPESEVSEYAEILVSDMQRAMYHASGQSSINPTVEIVVEADIGTSWADKH